MASKWPSKGNVLIMFQAPEKLKEDIVKQAGREAAKSGKRTTMSGMIRKVIEWYLQEADW